VSERSVTVLFVSVLLALGSTILLSPVLFYVLEATWIVGGWIVYLIWRPSFIHYDDADECEHSGHRWGGFTGRECQRCGLVVSALPD
jgi:hypothetical protein